MSDTLLIPQLRLDNPEVFNLHQEQLGLQMDWFNKAQADAWKQFNDLPHPVRNDEKWRFAKLARLKEIGRFEPTTGQAPDITGLVEKSNRIKDASGTIIFADDTLAAPVALDPELAKKGVIFTTLLEAITKHPKLVSEYFMQQSPELGSAKYEALHVALLRNGTFLYIPDDVEIAAPFVVYNWAIQANSAVFPHTLFIAGNHSKASLVEFQDSVDPDTEHLIIANAHLYAGVGSKPNHTIVQNWNLKTLSFQLNTNNAHRDTEPTSTLINVGSAQVRQEVHGKIFGSGSNVRMNALNVPSGEQEFDQRTLQTHLAGHSRSDLLFKNALSGSARTIFSGLIIVEEDAQQTDAYQTNNNLMLSDRAEANSLPGLEIKANDVKCSHGATTGRIDERELFYFLARGIPRSKAQELMVFGYFEEIIQKLDNPELAEYVRGLVQHKLTA